MNDNSENNLSEELQGSNNESNDIGFLTLVIITILIMLVLGCLGYFAFNLLLWIASVINYIL